jgi:hypothetical protein
MLLRLARRSVRRDPVCWERAELARSTPSGAAARSRLGKHIATATPPTTSGTNSPAAGRGEETWKRPSPGKPQSTAVAVEMRGCYVQTRVFPAFLRMLEIPDLIDRVRAYQPAAECGSADSG